MKAIKVMGLLTGLFFSANTFAATLVCDDIKLIKETFVACDDQDSQTHGGMQLCGNFKTVTDFIPQLSFDVAGPAGATFEEKYVTLSVTAMNSVEQETVPCQADVFGGSKIKTCALSNGTQVDLIHAGTNAYQVMVFAPAANSPSAVVGNFADSTCELN